eukprot:TRINITY_DN773070_c0_g1_i1.p1 TRINITY_DN773070_c0_g1~~TRINITY_DN773070_c0_g1_i1.p1  ORF type:complete len:319 (-),score=71.93 TRINITY_DN773070_c0_g1_i1:211-1167(-)
METLSFLTHWSDPASGLTHNLRLCVFKDRSIELYDLDKNRCFLRKVDYPTKFSKADLTIGQTITVFSRRLEIVAYHDGYTKSHFESISNACVLVQAPFKNLSEILSIIMTETKLVAVRMCQSSKMTKYAFVEFLSQEDTDLYSTLGRLALYYSDIKECVSVNDLSFEANTREDHHLAPCCLVLVKPHAMNKDTVEGVLKRLEESGNEIEAIKTLHFTLQDARDFYQAYMGVCDETREWVNGIQEGLSLAVKMSGDCVHQMRALVGPYDPEIARGLRPRSLRALYGKTTIKNAIHVTDLPEDGLIECRFVFDMMETTEA